MTVRAVIVGGGHNGLAAAALARAGVRTLVLERRPLLGGACVTEELWPGFRVSRAAYVVGLLRPALVRELELVRHGLRLIARDPSSYTPLPDRRGLFLGPDLARSCEEIRRFSPRDAERYPAYEALLDGIGRAVEPLLDAPPPDLARHAQPPRAPPRSPWCSRRRAAASNAGSRASPCAAPSPPIR